VEVRFEGGDEEQMQVAFGVDFPYRPQGDGDLGQRMRRAFDAKGVSRGVPRR
jgi:glycosyltransferase A (GT-A) superfamily protein (DUF2064 family)